MGEGQGGCGGKLILVVVVALLVIAGAAWLTGEMAKYNDAEASRLYARSELAASEARGQAEIVRAQDQARVNQILAESQARLDTAVGEAQMMMAQGQARLDSAQAFAVTAGAGLPWLVVTLVGIAGVVLLLAIVAIFGLALAAISQRQQPFLPAPRRVHVIDQEPVYLDLPALQEADYETRRLR